MFKIDPLFAVIGARRQIINAFPLEDQGPHHGLSKFKSWIDGFDPLLDQVHV